MQVHRLLCSIYYPHIKLAIKKHQIIQCVINIQIDYQAVQLLNNDGNLSTVQPRLFTRSQWLQIIGVALYL